MVFVVGGLAGAFAYMLTYPIWKEAGILDDIVGGKTTLAVTGNESYGALFSGIPGWLVALVIGVVFIAIAWILPRRPGPGSRSLPHGLPAH